MAAQGDEILAVGDPTSGKLWILPVDDAGSFTPELTPVAEDLDGLSLAVGKDDRVHAVVPDGTVRTWEMAPDGFAITSEGAVAETQTGDDLEITAVGAQPVVLDRTQGWVSSPDEDPVEIGDAETVQVQHPGPTADSVALTTDTELLEVSLEDGDVVRIEADDTGTPVRPVRLGG